MFLARVTDGLQNLVSGLGTTRDKSYHSDYSFVQLLEQQLHNAYRSSSIVRKIVDLPAEDSVREWREWHAMTDQITAIEAEEKRLNIQANIIEARRYARLYGGAAIYIATKNGSPNMPLRPEQIGVGGISHLAILYRSDLKDGPIQKDPNKPGFREPEYYELKKELDGSNSIKTRIHPSRLVIFKGENQAKTSQTITSVSDSWGDSVIQGLLEYVKRYDSVIANTDSLVYEAKVDVIKIKNFTNNLREVGTAFEQLMLRRTNLAMTAKGINGALLLDAEEEYEQKSADFGTLPEIMDRFMQSVSAAASIPMTLLFGMSPGGLNATGESDIRGYYDRVKTGQTLHLMPTIKVLDECTIVSALGARPPEVYYTWKPLWQPTAKERAEVGKAQMDAITQLNTLSSVQEPEITDAEGKKTPGKVTRVIPVEALAAAAVNALTESAAFPGLEGFVNAWLEKNGMGRLGDPNGTVNLKTATPEGANATQ